MSCPFCESPRVIVENKHALALYDNFPVAEGHMLIIPRKHIPDYFDVPRNIRNAMWDLVSQAKQHVQNEFNPDAFNVGINCGPAAGQTVFHAHIHLIPRYAGDVENPRGGVRGVVPHKKTY